MGLKKMGRKRTDGDFLRNIIMPDNEDIGRLWEIAERLDWLDKFQTYAKEKVMELPTFDEDGDAS